MAILREIIFSAFLCIVTFQIPIQANPTNPPAENLQDDYYNVTPTMTNQFVPQDEIDAKAIIDSNKKHVVIARIFTHRDKIRRYAINAKTADFNFVHARWINRNQIVAAEESIFIDFCFALVEREATVLGNYIHHFIANGDKQRLGFAMVLTKDTRDMINNFNNHYQEFNLFIDALGNPNAIMVKNWTKQNREPLEKGELDIESVKKDANALNTEYQYGGWKTPSAQLEGIFFKKSIKYARAVIAEFEKLNNGKPIEDIFACLELNSDFASTYRTFARYIKNKHTFIAELLQQYSDSSDSWSVWIMCMAVIHPQEWSKVNDAFKKINKGGSLANFITGKKIDQVPAEMMAMIIDPSFKPTQF